MAISKEDIELIRTKLDASERPLFLHDDDPDGLVSFLLLYNRVKKGNGVIINATPELKKEYLRKIDEYGSDLIVILDKPKVSNDFFAGIKDTPVIWIDHHEPQTMPKGVLYFNPRIENDSDNRPVSYIAYQINGDRKEMWLSMVGCVSDWFLPDFKDEFIKEFPDLLSKKHNTPPKALFDSEPGRLCRIFSFILKGKTNEVGKLIKIFTRIESPYEILKHETPRGKLIYKHYESMEKEYSKILKSIDTSDSKIILFIYDSNKVSFTSDLSNELLHRNPKKVIVIGRKTPEEVKMSLRSSMHDLPSVLEKALVGVDGYGGGHKNACGSAVKKKDFDKFIEQLKKEL